MQNALKLCSHSTTVTLVNELQLPSLSSRLSNSTSTLIVCIFKLLDKLILKFVCIESTAESNVAGFCLLHNLAVAHQLSATRHIIMFVINVQFYDKKQLRAQCSMTLFAAKLFVINFNNNDDDVFQRLAYSRQFMSLCMYTQCYKGRSPYNINDYVKYNFRASLIQRAAAAACLLCISIIVSQSFDFPFLLTFHLTLCYCDTFVSTLLPIMCVYG